MTTAACGTGDRFDPALIIAGLAVLDEDIRHIEETLLRLDELRGLVIKRDDANLASLLERIEAEAAGRSAHELKRQSVRRKLADAFGCASAEEMTLSRVESESALPEGTRVQVAMRREKLRLLVEKLRKEYTATVLLLADCARFNRLLLESVFELGKPATVVYGADGAARRQSGANLVNMRL